MKAPSARRNTSKDYKGYIDTKVPRKTNTLRKANDNERYYSAVLYIPSKCSPSSVMYSVDNKNKLRVSSATPAVDQRCTIANIFPTTDSPNYWVHNFPTPGYLITPAGYLEMTPPNPPKLTPANHGRQKYSLPE